MKGISNIILAVLFLIITVSLSGAFMMWGTSSTQTIEGDIEEKFVGEKTGLGATFIITDVTFDITNYNNPPNVTIMNNGKADLNVLELEIYLNGTRHTLEPWDPTDVVISPGESAVLKIKQ